LKIKGDWDIKVEYIWGRLVCSFLREAVTFLIPSVTAVSLDPLEVGGSSAAF
jgi:hypothetical protein